ncbi:2471f0fd-7df2-4cc5-b40e-c8b6f5c8c521 [Sclerotinia trifoliorum]|uniref:Protein BCP1 n=1 Tax=Sclerotinia trifoliorum TaxID=28548 RepID=A0A8H2ZW83_9HELO|nr:2471f0fd-7df2-4cc5-b40e-c8b6f5c8c521 [Sclerotinia trifoliorum]
MVKKRVRDPEELPDAPTHSAGEENDSGSDGEDILNVDFEWFNFREIDFHGVKSLIRQLFDVDSQLLDLSGLADEVVKQGTIGSTVKVDGEGTDAYAFMTVLNLHRGNVSEGDKGEKEVGDAVRGLRGYLASQAKEGGLLQRVVGGGGQLGGDVGVVLAERLINVPAEVAPPMYGMLVDELEAAVEDGEPYDFAYYLVVSRGYREVESRLDREEQGPKSKKSKGKARASGELFYFHPEDEVLKRFSCAYEEFDYKKDEGEGMADSKRAFQEMGIRAVGELILIEKAKWEECVKALGEYLGAPVESS